MLNFIKNIIIRNSNGENQTQIVAPKENDTNSLFDENKNVIPPTNQTQADENLYLQSIEEQNSLEDNQTTLVPILITQDNTQFTSTLEENASVVIVKGIDEPLVQGPLSEVTEVAPKEETQAAETKEAKYNFDFEVNLDEEQQRDLEKFKQNYENNKDKYEEVEQATGVPAELIAAIHWRESGGNFNTYLHNGDPLGKKMVHEPKLKTIYYNWTDSAIDAINRQDTSIINKDDINTLFEYAERYNGLGYRKKGVSSPYVWSGTSNYTSGKYVADGSYSANVKDDQLGIAVMMKAICA